MSVELGFLKKKFPVFHYTGRNALLDETDGRLDTIAIPLSTVFSRISAAALINSPMPQMRRLFEGGAYSSNYCNWQLKSLLHLGQIVITFRTKCYYI